MALIAPIRNWYGKYERPISSLSLFLGFAFDTVALKRIDTLWENIWIFAHLVIVGVFIILIHVQESEAGDEKNPSKAHFWYVNILQFVFGGTISAFLVFYFRSTDIWTTWPFFTLLAIAFVANESLKRHYTRFSFQISLFFLSIYSFTIFLVPVVLHKINSWTFLLSGLISLVLIMLFIALLFYFVKDKFAENKKNILLLILGIFATVNLLYFTNLIPPIPLSLKDAGMYHSVRKENSSYVVTYEDYGWRGYFKLYPDFTEMPGRPVYAFSAIFSPKDLNLTVLHEWQHSVNGKWITERVISLPVVGGRDGGFRTYSTRSNLAAGKWRVNIKTEQGLTIGHLRFNIIPSDISPTLSTMVK